LLFFSRLRRADGGVLPPSRRLVPDDVLGLVRYLREHALAATA
jgi:hypothetical protein